MNLNEYEIDIEGLLDTVYMGPQAEVLQEIDTFNLRYISRRYNPIPAKKLGITNKFYWKPGAYDTIKTIVYNQCELHKKACSLSKVVQRVREVGHWRMRELWNAVDRIESKLFRLRREGIRCQDNTEELNEYWNVIKNKLIEQQELCHEMGGLNDGITFSINPAFNDYDTLYDYNINIKYLYEDLKIHYRDVNNPETIAEIFCPGETVVIVKLSLVKLLNLLSAPGCSGDLGNIGWQNAWAGNRGGTSPFAVGGNYNNMYELQHPFISSHAGGWAGDTFNGEFKYVCMGNLGENISLCIKAFDFVSLKVFMDRLVSHYDTSTGPLNPLMRSFYGKPNFIGNNEDFYSRVSNRSYTDCSYRHILKDMHLDDIEERSYCNKFCTIKESCTDYKDATKTLTKEEIERQELERITLNAARRIQ